MQLLPARSPPPICAVERHLFTGWSAPRLLRRATQRTPRRRSAARYRSRVEDTNIGFAVYSRGDEPGTLEARWTYENRWAGPGKATGGPEHGFAGEYHIRYYLDGGEFSDEYDLQIERAGDLYELRWLTDGEVDAIGVGMEVEGRLAVGWRRVSD